ncbi:HD domain-containing protein [Streptomyces violaceorubidus]|uniref:HD domain-containing protein n=1 Tax=Streptomyces violaceorubidus TaxID=284042 RepID=UPI0004C26683|nr:HD domain-containing protein [Streptomyces violaceorubidus]
MAAGPDKPGAPDSGADGAGSPGLPPEALPESWQPLLGRPALAELLGHPLASAALTEMRRLLPPHVAVHSLRTFLLADACARSHGTAYDRVGLLAAAAFHDAGLVGRSPLGRGGFPARSAQLLDVFLAGHEVGMGRRTALTRAVREHLRPFPARDAGPEARLLHFGAWLDVTGRGARQIPGDRGRLAALAPTPWFAVSFSARVVACGLRRVLPGSPVAPR